MKTLWLRISINIEPILNLNFMLREFQTVKIKTRQTEENKKKPIHRHSILELIKVVVRFN